MTRLAPARLVLVGLILIAMIRAAPADPGPDSVMIEDLTWPEIKARMEAGATTIIVPTGGTEQNGPHMVLGKHNVIIRYTADAIARRLGKVLVAPVLAYVPEGSWDPPEGHMRFPGSISLPDRVYEGVLESAARSFAAEGFKTVLFLGDSGPNQRPQAAVAQKLDAELKPRGIRVLQVGDYYTHNGQEEWLKSQGFTEQEIGVHAALIDTAQLMAIDPEGVRTALLASSAGNPDGSKNGVIGDPAGATAAIGRKLLELKIEAAVRQIRQEVAAIP
ncbi:creatininase family protein [Dongia sedimenti]|uniref:Creatininase family protein n=1 Tax=Dongia sedimenti TaxID=3064282 RepID=A0ABU0YRB2_9PROT|nr:creatininase family protein [Rhodospirillaceae bacterium R-7]